MKLSIKTSKPSKIPAARKRNKPATTDLEETFRKLFLLTRAHWSQPQREFVFHAKRKWRFDFAWPELRVAVELQGGIFKEHATGHRAIGKLMQDYEKMNAAQLDGWRVFQFHAKDLSHRPLDCVQICCNALMIAAKERSLPNPFSESLE